MNLRQFYVTSSNNKKLSSGFTLIELLVTVSVVGIVTALAMPRFQSMVANNRFVSQINNFNGAIALARSEAIKHGRPVSIIPTTNTNWADGWDIVLPGANANQILSHVDAFNGNTILASNVTIPAIQFTDDGRINTINNIVFTLCNVTRNNPKDKEGKELTLSSTGITYLNSRYICP